MENGPFKFSYKDRTRESLTLAVYNCGSQKCTPEYSWGPGVRDHYLIHYVQSGKGFCESGGTVREIGPGGLFLIYPGQPIRYWADPSEPWEYDWVGFNGGDAGYLLERTDFTRECPVLHYSDGRIPASLRAIAEAHGRALSDQTRMLGRLYEFLAVLLELATSSNAAKGFDYIGSAVRFIARNYAAPIHVADIARGIGVSRSHLYRVFMEQMGLPPTEYLTRYRISQAQGLLRDGKLSVASAANSVGYEDPLYFSRVFRKITGQSPRDYAQSQTGGDK